MVRGERTYRFTFVFSQKRERGKIEVRSFAQPEPATCNLCLKPETYNLKYPHPETLSRFSPSICCKFRIPFFYRGQYFIPSRFFYDAAGKMSG